MNTVVQYDIGALLEMAGARSRGNRHDCPKCGAHRMVTHTEEYFYCHKCGWKGNEATLRKELGIYRRTPSAEYLEQSRKRRLANDASRRLYAAAHKLQLELRERLRELGRLELAAHDAGPGDPNTWGMLSRVYDEKTRIEADLDALESADPVTVLERLRCIPKSQTAAQNAGRASVTFG